MLGRTLYGRGNGHAFIRQLKPALWLRRGIGQSAGTWADQSGNGRDLTLFNSPTLNADGSYTFDGVNQYGNVVGGFTLNQPETVYLLFKQVSWTNTDYCCDGNSASTLTIQQITSTPSIRLLASESGAATNGNLAVGAYGVACGVFNGASSLLQVNMTTPTTGDPGSNNAGGFTLGASAAWTAHANIQVLEAIVFSAAHDASQRARCVRYLAGIGGVSL